MTILPIFQETQPGVAFPDCTCEQGRKPPCICAETLAERESLPAALWRNVCRFFVDPEFDARIDAYARRVDVYARRQVL